MLALTGWSAAAITDAGRVRGDGSSLPTWPGFHPDLVAFLLANRPQVAALGIDSPSLDSPAAEEAGSPAHRRWLGGLRYGIEFLRGLEALPPAGATLVVGVLRLAGGSGAPARVVAML
nr:cyclase [uncultured bacterium]